MSGKLVFAKTAIVYHIDGKVIPHSFVKRLSKYPKLKVAKLGTIVAHELCSGIPKNKRA